MSTPRSILSQGFLEVVAVRLAVGHPGFGYKVQILHASLESISGVYCDLSYVIVYLPGLHFIGEYCFQSTVVTAPGGGGSLARTIINMIVSIQSEPVCFAHSAAPLLASCGHCLYCNR